MSGRRSILYALDGYMRARRGGSASEQTSGVRVYCIVDVGLLASQNDSDRSASMIPLSTVNKAESTVSESTRAQVRRADKERGMYLEYLSIIAITALTLSLCLSRTTLHPLTRAEPRFTYLYVQQFQLRHFSGAS